MAMSGGRPDRVVAGLWRQAHWVTAVLAVLLVDAATDDPIHPPGGDARP